MSKRHSDFVSFWSCPVVMVFVIALAPPCIAQDTTIYLDLPNVSARHGEVVRLPIWIANYTYPIAGYSLRFTLDRPGLVAFDSVTVMDPTATLSEGWEYLAGAPTSEQSARVTGIADITGDDLPPPIPPMTLGQTLVILQARVYCDPDTLSGTMVQVLPTGLLEFSDPDGNLILPVSATGGMIGIVNGEFGDVDASGAIDVIDVVLIINCAFRNACLPCGSPETDLNCDGATTVLDVVTAVNHVFRDGPPPGC